MGTTGYMKHCAFATFIDKGSAEQAMQRLHQVDLLGRRLVVEFATKQMKEQFLSPTNDESLSEVETTRKNSDREGNDISSSDSRLTLTKDTVYAKYGINYHRNPGLSYLYPPPTVSTLTNIAYALADHPKFYFQVLHLMNKMNMPPPFGPVTQSHPLVDDTGGTTVAMETSESDESEIESDPDTRSRSIQGPIKRHLKMFHHSTTKRPKYIPPPLPAPEREPTYISPMTSDVFELQDANKPKPISLVAPASLTAPNSAQLGEERTPTDNVITEETISGFGKLQPLKQEQEGTSSDEDNETHINPSKFLTMSQITSGRISSRQMKEMPTFKNYSPGEPSSRIYIKNLSKKVTDEDLINLFGSFAEYDTEQGKNMFYVQLMDGRMQGQAFVTLVSEQAAKTAVKNVNGFLLHGKPIVVQFARTAKPKSQNE